MSSYEITADYEIITDKDINSAIFTFIIINRLREQQVIISRVDSQPVLCVVDRYQVPDELLVCLAPCVAAFAPQGTEHRVVVKRIVYDWVTYERACKITKNLTLNYN